MGEPYRCTLPGTSCRARALAPPLWGSSRRSRVRGAQGCTKSLPPSRGKVARPQAVTDEGARQVSAPYRNNSDPNRPLIRPSVRTGAPSPRRVEGLPCGGRGFCGGDACRARALPLPLLSRFIPLPCSHPVLSPCLVPIPFYPLTGIGKGRTLALRAVVVERIAGPGGDGEGMRNPPVTACGGASPLWQGGLWSGDDHWEVLVGAGLRPGPSPGSMWFQKGGAGQSPPPTALPTAVFGLSCGIGA